MIDCNNGEYRDVSRDYNNADERSSMKEIAKEVSEFITRNGESVEING